MLGHIEGKRRRLLLLERSLLNAPCAAFDPCRDLHSKTPQFCSCPHADRLGSALGVALLCAIASDTQRSADPSSSARPALPAVGLSLFSVGFGPAPTLFALHSDTQATLTAATL